MRAFSVVLAPASLLEEGLSPQSSRLNKSSPSGAFEEFPFDADDFYRCVDVMVFRNCLVSLSRFPIFVFSQNPTSKTHHLHSASLSTTVTTALALWNQVQNMKFAENAQRSSVG